MFTTNTHTIIFMVAKAAVTINANVRKTNIQLTYALRHTSTPLSISLAGSTVCSLECVAYITGVGHYRVVGCTGETALTISGSTRITTVNSCSR